MDMQLNDKTALVTGASVGIGEGIALALAAEGVQLALTARRMDKLQAVAAAIVAAGGKAPILIAQDMYAEDAAQQLSQAALKGLGRVDILINNAGGSRSFKDLHVSEAQWQEAMTLNFHRPRQLADALIDQMIANCWGRMGASTRSKFFATTPPNTASGNARTKSPWHAMASPRTWPIWSPFWPLPGPVTSPVRSFRSMVVCAAISFECPVWHAHFANALNDCTPHVQHCPTL